MPIQQYPLVIITFFTLFFVSSKCSPANRPNDKIINVSEYLLQLHSPKLVQSMHHDHDRIDEKTKTLNLPSSSSSSQYIHDDSNSHNKNARRHRRCLVEAVLYSRALKDKDSLRNKRKLILLSQSGDRSSPSADVRSRSKRSTDGRSITYFTFGNPHQPSFPFHPQPAELQIVEVAPESNGKVVYPSNGGYGFYRPILLTPSGIKVWGAGSESKFPPVLEYLVQRVQSYFSVYKYEDESRPGLDWVTKPEPKPGDKPEGELEDVSIADNNLESNAVPLPEMILN